MTINVENRFELWKVDEYGHGAILASSTDYEELVEKGKNFVNTDNMENALAGDEKMKNWESYFVEILDNEDIPIENALYAGKSGAGKHLIQLISNGEVEEDFLENTDVAVRIFVGRDDRGTRNKGTDLEEKLVSDIFASDVKRVKDDMGGNTTLQEIKVSDVNDRSLEGKTAYFVRRVKTLYQPK